MTSFRTAPVLGTHDHSVRAEAEIYFVILILWEKEGGQGGKEESGDVWPTSHPVTLVSSMTLVLLHKK